MHKYTTDSREEKFIYPSLAAISILVVYLIRNYIPNVPIQYTAVFIIYGANIYLFDRFIWKISLLKKVGIIKTPNLNGEWKGYFQSIHDDFKEKNDAYLSITQRWTKIEITFKSDQSRSMSRSGSMLVKQEDGIQLMYEYANNPDVVSTDTMHYHLGTAHLKLIEDGLKWILDGDYYTGRDRSTFGSLHFEKRQ